MHTHEHVCTHTHIHTVKYSMAFKKEKLLFLVAIDDPKEHCTKENKLDSGNQMPHTLASCQGLGVGKTGQGFHNTLES